MCIKVTENMSTTLAGSEGEDRACEYVMKRGYRVLHRNYRIRGGEIDIVARSGEYLVFIEVKTRWSHEFGLPADSMTPWKVRHLLKAANVYLQKIQWGDRPYRLDFISIDFADSKEDPKIELIQNITGF